MRSRVVPAGKNEGGYFGFGALGGGGAGGGNGRRVVGRGVDRVGRTLPGGGPLGADFFAMTRSYGNSQPLLEV
jgi:hypothetical protein